MDPVQPSSPEASSDNEDTAGFHIESIFFPYFSPRPADRSVSEEFQEWLDQMVDEFIPPVSLLSLDKRSPAGRTPEEDKTVSDPLCPETYAKTTQLTSALDPPGTDDPNHDRQTSPPSEETDELQLSDASTSRCHHSFRLSKHFHLLNLDLETADNNVSALLFTVEDSDEGSTQDPPALSVQLEECEERHSPENINPRSSSLKDVTHPPTDDLQDAVATTSSSVENPHPDSSDASDSSDSVFEKQILKTLRCLWSISQSVSRQLSSKRGTRAAKKCKNLKAGAWETGGLRRSLRNRPCRRSLRVCRFPSKYKDFIVFKDKK
nr:PREDICTED: uncharacterized protein LOC109644993 [Paralichthys olivaceus]